MESVEQRMKKLTAALHAHNYKYYVLNQPEEVPSTPVKITVRQIEEEKTDSSFDKFDFAKAVHWYE